MLSPDLSRGPRHRAASVRAQSGSSFERTFAISAISLPSFLLFRTSFGIIVVHGQKREINRS